MDSANLISTTGPKQSNLQGMLAQIKINASQNQSKEGANQHPSTSGNIPKSTSMENLEETKDQPRQEVSAFEQSPPQENLFKDDHDGE